MRSRIFIVMLVLLMVFPLVLPAQETADDPIIKTAAVTDINIGNNWIIAPTITIPPLRLQESIRSNAKMDIVFTASVGGGIAFKYVDVDPITGEETAKFSWSPFTVILTGDTTENLDKVDVAYAMTFGFFDDLIMTGFGYNFGDNLYETDAGGEIELSRWFMLVGFGVTFGG